MIEGFRPHKRVLKESSVQDPVVRWARETYRGRLIARKSPTGKFGTNGDPDYEFLIEGGRSFFIEFKAPGGTCTDLQLQRHAELRALGHKVFVCDDVTAGKGIVRTEMERKRRVGSWIERRCV